MLRISKLVLSLALAAVMLPLSAVGAAGTPVLSETPQVKAGKDFSIARQWDGTVWAWGAGESGQLGNGKTTGLVDPAKIPGLKDVNAISAGEYHALALKKDGTVWAWGAGSYGQIGDGSVKDRTKPVQVKKLSKIVAIEAGGSQSFAIKDDGTLWAWGRNDYGALGDDSTANRTQPVQIKGISKVKAVATGMNFTVALKTDGTVWTWGYNADGQVGDGSFRSTYKPAQIKGIKDIIAIASGGSHALALKKDGTVWAWGRNTDGQLADGTADSKGQPIKVQDVSSITSIGAGRDFSYAIKKDGTVWGWGSNYRGQLGLGTDSIYQQRAVVQVEDLTGSVAIDGGELHALALKKDGSVWGMGRNADGQIGNGGGKEAYGPITVSELNVKKPITAKTPKVTGGKGSVKVEGVNPYGLVTLVSQPDLQTVTVFGTKTADAKGTYTFTNLPEGSGYFAYETVNGVRGQYSNSVTVTSETVDELISPKSLQITSQYDAEQSVIKLTINAHFSGATPVVRVKMGSSIANVSDYASNSMSFTKEYRMDEIEKFFTIEATLGSQKQIIHTKLGTDLIEDWTVSLIQSKNSKTQWIATMNSHLRFAGPILFVNESDEQLSPVSEGDLTPEELERIHTIQRDKNGVIISNKERQDMKLIAYDETKQNIEVLYVMPNY